jgi:hypothetical protein
MAEPLVVTNRQPMAASEHELVDAQADRRIQAVVATRRVPEGFRGFRTAAIEDERSGDHQDGTVRST